MWPVNPMAHGIHHFQNVWSIVLHYPTVQSCLQRKLSHMFRYICVVYISCNTHSRTVPNKKNHTGSVMGFECDISWVRVPIGSNQRLWHCFCCFSTDHTALRRKSKGWLAWSLSADCCFGQIKMLTNFDWYTDVWRQFFNRIHDDEFFPKLFNWVHFLSSDKNIPKVAGQQKQKQKTVRTGQKGLFERGRLQ